MVKKESAMIELTAEQQQALDVQPVPAQVLDPRTNTAYILVRADVYKRLQALLHEDFHPADSYPAIDRTFSDGWNDPKMDDYDRYEELKP
jgi:predicted ATPase